MSARRDGERGVAAIEFIGIFPFVVLLALLVFQLGVAGWATSTAGQAARMGARQATLDLSSAQRRALEAVPAQLRGGAKVNANCEGDVCSATVVIAIPQVIPFITPGSVDRSAQMPRIS